MKPAITWTLRVIPAVLIGQTLPFKFSGAADPVRLFTELADKTLGNPGMEAAMRIGTGVIELIALVLFLIPKYSAKGALLVVGTMVGALASHALFIGFAGWGPMPVLAVVALICAAAYLALSRRKLS